MSHERERPGRCTVQPLRVIGHAQQRPLLGGIRDQTEHCEPDEKRARHLSRAQPERDAERLTLRVGKTLLEVEDRRAELLQRCVIELHFTLDAQNPDDAKVLGCLDRELEQRGLANPRVAVHDEDRAVAAPRGIEQSVEHRSFALPTEQPPGLRAGDHLGSMPSE
jgi:hypothetical protein